MICQKIRKNRKVFETKKKNKTSFILTFNTLHFILYIYIKQVSHKEVESLKRMNTVLGVTQKQ